ncbi:MAG: TIGR02757 family protein, partial [Bergeyella sp.]
MNFNELKDYLDIKADQYNHSGFIENDPIQIPHRFTEEKDIEIAGFLTAVISWGNRKSIIKSAGRMLGIMDNAPYDFVMNFKEKDLESARSKAIHRTFSGEDFIFFLKSLKSIYTTHHSLENLFLIQQEETNFYHAFERFRAEFLKADEMHRSRKHISSTYKNSSAKRLMMFMRWMVRRDQRNVDFGIWNCIEPKFLS